jgi:hypothetical protein
MMKSNIFGSWELERFDIIEPSKTTRPWGKKSSGLLIYTADCHMSVSINRDIEPTSFQDPKSIFDSILFYSGTYKVVGDIISHQVMNASNPSRIGKEMIRYAELQRDLLTLKSPVETFGQAVLVWRKIK